MPRLAVLESTWNKRGGLLKDEPSVLPYLDAVRRSLAWDGIRLSLVYRRFHSSDDLRLLLQEIRRPPAFSFCYIGSHGRGRQLLGLGDNIIRLRHLMDHCRPSRGIGYIFGACDFLTPDTAMRFLLATGARFVAGYQKAIPWTESTLVDCLFLSYLLGGTMKWVRAKHGERVPPLRALEDFEITRSTNPQTVVGRLYRDCPLSHDITFSCFTLERGRGRKPMLVNSFEQHRRAVDQARRLVRHI